MSIEVSSPFLSHLRVVFRWGDGCPVGCWLERSIATFKCQGMRILVNMVAIITPLGKLMC